MSSNSIFLGRVKEVTSGFIKALVLGKRDARTGPQVSPAGIQSKPVKEDMAVYAKTTNSTEPIFLGYVQKTNETNEGEIKVLSYDSEGAESFVIYIRNDGTCEFGGDADNMVRYSELKKEYDKTRAVLDAILTTLATPVNEPGNGAPSVFQAAMILAVGALTTGDISGSKIDNIKTN